MIYVIAKYVAPQYITHVRCMRAVYIIILRKSTRKNTAVTYLWEELTVGGGVGFP